MELKKALAVTATPPEGLLMSLLPFQLESLAWMSNQENKTKFKGGILADEMGDAQPT